MSCRFCDSWPLAILSRQAAARRSHTCTARHLSRPGPTPPLSTGSARLAFCSEFTSGPRVFSTFGDDHAPRFDGALPTDHEARAAALVGVHVRVAAPGARDDQVELALVAERPVDIANSIVRGQLDGGRRPKPGTTAEDSPPTS